MNDEAREHRLAENEALARDVNERVGEVAAAWYPHGEPLEFVCECSRDDCTHRVHLRMEEYREVRSRPVWFAVVPDHIEPEIERSVKTLGDALVVEKTGVGRDVAEETAPNN
jgi:hypothetical protein